MKCGNGSVGLIARRAALLCVLWAALGPISARPCRASANDRTDGVAAALGDDLADVVAPEHPVEHEEDETMSMDGSITPVELGNVEITLKVQIDAEPDECFRAFTQDIAHWYSTSYVFGGSNTSDIVLELQPGGRMMEVYKGGGGHLWGIVTDYDPANRHITIGLPDGVGWSGTGQWDVTCAAAESGSGTTLTLTHFCTQEYIEDGQSGYMQGWKKLIVDNFKAYAEGRPVDDAIRPGT